MFILSVRSRLSGLSTHDRLSGWGSRRYRQPQEMTWPCAQHECMGCSSQGWHPRFVTDSPKVIYTEYGHWYGPWVVPARTSTARCTGGGATVCTNTPMLEMASDWPAKARVTDKEEEESTGVRKWTVDREEQGVWGGMSATVLSR